MEKRSEGLPTLVYPLHSCFETEVITTEHACIFKHCGFETTLVSHVLIKALVEIKEKCMAGGGWGIAPLLQKSNFCEPKRPNNFCNVNRRDVDRLPNNDQLFRFRTLTSCYAMLCFAIFIPTSNIGYSPITMLPKHSLSGHSGRPIRNSVTTIWFPFLIIYSF